MAQGSAAYNFSLFEPYDYGTAAPELEPLYEPDEPVKTPKKKKSQSHGVSNEAKNATRVSFFRSVKAMLCVFCVFAVVCIAMYLNVRLDETAAAINSVEESIDVAKSENVRLHSALEGMVSIDKIEDYAENNLGMVKLENYKITYFESDEGNHVVVSGGRSYDSQVGAKLKNFTEYFFGN